MWNSTLWFLGLGLISAALLPGSARAQERIQSLRLGRHPGYQRIVLEVADAAEAYTTGEPKRIEIDAEPPPLAPATLEQLAALGVRLERAGRKTQIVLEAKALPWAAFRLKQGAPRIVVDLGSGAPALPDGAETLREIAARPQPSLAASPPDVSGDRPPLPPPVSVEEPGRADVRVRVQGLDLVGLLPKGPTRAEILQLRLPVRRTAAGDWEAASGASDAQQRSLLELTSSAAGEGSALMGSVLQQVVERIAALYADRELFGTQVDIRQSDVDRLSERAAPLVVHIRAYRPPIQ